MREVRCPSCSTLNRVRDYSVTSIPRCGKPGCGAALPELAGTKAIRFLYRYRVWATPFLLTAVVASYLWIIANRESSTHPPIATNPATLVTCVIQKPPPQGEFESSDFSPRVAPFKINTGAGFNYLVKLESAQNAFTSISFFVYGGVPFETDVPLGTYVLKYAAGKTWCGRKDLFGKNTFAKKGSTLLVFDQEADGYGGREVTLIAEVGGNFHTEYIKLSEF